MTAAVVPRVPSNAVVTLAVLLVLTVPGAAIGATTAQPGQPLYGAKLGIERARVALAAAPERNVAAHVGLAEQRLEELDQLGRRSAHPQVVQQVSQDLNDHAVAANERLPEVGASERSELTSRLSTVVATQVNVLDTLVDLGCPDNGTEACIALGETQEESLALRDKTPTTVVAAVSTPAGASAQTGSEEAAKAAVPNADNPRDAGAADTEGSGASRATTAEDPETPDPDASTAGDDTSAASPTPTPTPTTGAPANTSTDEPTQKPVNNSTGSTNATGKAAKSAASESSDEPTTDP